MSPDLNEWLRQSDSDGRTRCWWCGDDPLYTAYHDTEWGMPVRDDVRLFEKICLEGFQSGLSWITILRKRENFRSAFEGFDPRVVARFGPSDIERLMADAGIVRHRGKIEAVINNAQRFNERFAKTGEFAGYIWSFAPTEPEARPDNAPYIPAQTPSSTRLSKELRTLGWKYVGPTTVYAFMQSMGLVNDHLEGCEFRNVK